MNVLAKIHYELGETYADIARLLGVSPQYVWRVANERAPLSPFLVAAVGSLWPHYFAEAKYDYLAARSKKLNDYLDKMVYRLI